ncbi:unnamed protein product [Withania somnifera]
MGNSLRCCLACVLPCGALDLIRIVHLNGHVEEITSPITAFEVLKNYPNHVLSKPCSQGTMARRILILSSESELKREKSPKVSTKISNSMKCHVNMQDDHDSNMSKLNKSSSHRRSKSGKVVVWKPHLESISEH